MKDVAEFNGHVHVLFEAGAFYALMQVFRNVESETLHRLFGDGRRWCFSMHEGVERASG